jgi:ABC-type multidrug transport system fused ATPase/permease subunit
MFTKLNLSFKLVSIIYSNLSIRRKFHFKLLFALSVIASIFEVAALVSLYPFLTVLLSPEKLVDNEFYISFLNNFSIFKINILLLITFVFLSFLILSSVFRLVLLWTNIKLANAISRDLSLEIFENKIYQPYLDFINTNTNEAISGISVKTGSLNRVLIALNSLVTSVFLSLSILITVLLINPLVSFLSFITIFLVYLILVIKFNKTFSKNSFIISKQQTSILKILQESFGTIRDIILSSNQEKHSSYFFNSVKKTL